MIELVGLDADDTLWHNEPVYVEAREHLRALLTRYEAPEDLGERLYETERRNLRHFGYGVKGFVLSMVFVHAPLVFPTILGVPLPYRPAFYAHLALLHLSLAIRMTGDLVVGLDPLRAWGGLLNAVALLLFPLNMVRSVVLARREVSW